MLFAWVIFPAVLLVLCAGCGLAVRAAAGGPPALRPLLVLPVGLGAFIAVTNLATTTETTTPLGLPALLGLAAAGFVLSRRDLRSVVPEPWALGAAALVLLAYGAPVLGSGQASFTGYIKLDDSATWFALADQGLEYGRDMSRVEPSSFSRTLETYLSTGYPLGSFIPLAVGRALTGEDLAWLSVPYMATMGGLLALVLNELVGGLVTDARRRAAVVVVAAQPALLYGYVHWGGIKEMAAAVLVALVAALVPTLRGPVRGVVPLSVTIAGLMGVLSFGGGAWIAPILLVAVGIGRSYKPVLTLPVAGALTALLALPAVTLFGTFNTVAKVVLRSSAELGNLLGPLRTRQVLGIWPASDFRLAPENLGVTNGLMLLLLACALAGIILAFLRRSDGLVAYAVGGTAAFLVFLSRGSPWLDGKAMATAGPIALALGLAALAVGTSARLAPARIASAAAFIALAGGVFWSNALSYRAAYIAPRERLEALEQIGERIEGQGPTLMTEYEPYGVRHFLRDAGAEGASELRVRQIPLRDGSLLPKSSWADIGAFSPPAVQEFRTLVLRRTPFVSRPPSSFTRTWRSRDYEVWQRPVTGAKVPISDLPLGGGDDPGALPDCTAVRALADQAAPGTVLRAVPRAVPVLARLGALAIPPGWLADPADPRIVYPNASARQLFSVAVSDAGRYDVWLGGSSRGRLEVRVDGKRIRTLRHELTNPGGGMQLGTLALDAGNHDVSIDVDLGGLAPGVKGQDVTRLAMGPFVLAPSDDAREMITLPPDRAGELCGRRLDWVELGPR